MLEPRSGRRTKEVDKARDLQYFWINALPWLPPLSISWILWSTWVAIAHFAEDRLGYILITIDEVVAQSFNCWMQSRVIS